MRVFVFRIGLGVELLQISKTILIRILILHIDINVIETEFDEPSIFDGRVKFFFALDGVDELVAF